MLCLLSIQMPTLHLRYIIVTKQNFSIYVIHIDLKSNFSLLLLRFMLIMSILYNSLSVFMKISGRNGFRF